MRLNNKVVYRHIRLDINEVFYIGIGNKKRPYKNIGRNKYWNNIVNKTDYNVEVIAKGLTWEDACELECFLIQEYGRKDLKLGNLCNMTDGGDGTNNMIRTAQHCKRISKSLTDKKLSVQHRKNISLSKKNKLSHMKKDGTSFGSGVVIINTLTNVIYSSIAEVSRIHNLSYSGLKAKISGQNPNNTNFKYLKDVN